MTEMLEQLEGLSGMEPNIPNVKKYFGNIVHTFSLCLFKAVDIASIPFFENGRVHIFKDIQECIFKDLTLGGS